MIVLHAGAYGSVEHESASHDGIPSKIYAYQVWLYFFLTKIGRLDKITISCLSIPVILIVHSGQSDSSSFTEMLSVYSALANVLASNSYLD